MKLEIVKEKLLYAINACERVAGKHVSLPVLSCILLEARGESYLGQVAVGEVIRNRAFKTSIGIIEICLAPFQFSCWNNARKAEKAINRISGDEWQIASKAWEESKHTNYSKGATYYLAKNKLKYLPGWVNNLEETLR